ncbi:hypothetical protein Q0V21_31110 [Paenibacillus sp. 11B]|uniref:hypothetical protein n=1 Tax=Paenibacillus sp. 11B TaxID=3060965 RepID=UPI00264C507C|nr:hypothetical protein [Paenibacillus sp. 11B]MDN8593181.1 hypothetical protein [Paenibacillus sp. 11B]
MLTDKNFKFFAQGAYTHEDEDVLNAAFRELLKALGGNVTTRNGNTIVLRYPQVAAEEVALPIVKKHGLIRA